MRSFLQLRSILQLCLLALNVHQCLSCSSMMDCSLNGDCVGSKCVCDPAWSGSEKCDVMAFEPLDKNNMPGR
jgi:hypothetical protein